MELDRTDVKKILSGSSINRLNKEKVEEIRDAIDQKLKAINTIYGLNLKTGRIKFNDIEMTVNIKGVINSTEQGESGERAAFIRNASFSCDPVNANLVMKHGYGFKLDSGHIVYAFNKRAKRYSILAKKNDSYIKLSVGYLLSQIKERINV